MKTNSCKILLTYLVVALLGSCSSGSEEEPLPPTPPVDKKIPITLNCSVTANTRVTDTGYDSGDKTGLYVVNYDNGTAGTLANSGNHVNNICFTYNGTWTPTSPIYWKDETTPADFYCYYPYGTPTDVTAHAFSVKTDQSTPDAYKASEFLYGKATKVAPTEKAVNIMTAHLFSCAVIKVAAGNGFTEESLAAANVSVKLNGCKTSATINLRDGSVTATGDANTITPLKEEKQYKALIVPQAINADNFITVTIDGREYNLKKEFTFVSGKRYQFTATVSKTSNGINVGINPWDDDDKDYGGSAE